MPHEQLAKLIRQRASSKTRRSLNAAPRVGLSPLSLLCCGDKGPFCADLSRRLLAGLLRGLLGRNARGAFVVAANAKRAEGNAPGEYGDV